MAIVGSVVATADAAVVVPPRQDGHPTHSFYPSFDVESNTNDVRQ